MRLKDIFFRKKKEASVSSENWICSHQQPGADALLNYPNPLPQGWVGFHQASLLAMLHLHTVSLLHASYWSLNFSLAGLIFYETSAIFYTMPIVWVSQKKSRQRRGASRAVFSIALLLRVWEGPTPLLSVVSSLRHSKFLLVSLTYHKGRLKELNTYGFTRGSLRKAMIMFSNIWNV